jgi:hypothetical protein
MVLSYLPSNKVTTQGFFWRRKRAEDKGQISTQRRKGRRKAQRKSRSEDSEGEVETTKHANDAKRDSEWSRQKS